MGLACPAVPAAPPSKGRETAGTRQPATASSTPTTLKEPCPLRPTRPRRSHERLARGAGTNPERVRRLAEPRPGRGQLGHQLASPRPRYQRRRDHPPERAARAAQATFRRQAAAASAKPLARANAVRPPHRAHPLPEQLEPQALLSTRHRGSSFGRTLLSSARSTPTDGLDPLGERETLPQRAQRLGTASTFGQPPSRSRRRARTPGPQSSSKRPRPSTRYPDCAAPGLDQAGEHPTTVTLHRHLPRNGRAPCELAFESLRVGVTRFDVARGHGRQTSERVSL